MSARKTDTPNVVLIVLDAVRRDHLSCYGYGRRTTPNIDRLAEEAVLFQQAYTTSCWTIPAHASLFTGLYPSRHGADDLRADCLDSRHVTMAGYLGAWGYRTAAISCNGFISGYTNLDRGFQVSVDVGRLRGGSRGILPRVVRGLHRRWREQTVRDRGAARATKLALDWLSEQEAARPFFLFINYMDCHLPYRLRGADRYRFLGEGERERADAVPQDPFGVMAAERPLTRQALADLEALYDGALHYLDRQLGSLVRHLRNSGLYDRTLFVVTSDHGESFGEHGLMDHQYGLYEHLIAVPLLMRLPGGQRSAEAYRSPVQLIDLLPTMAGWLEGGSGDVARHGWDGLPIFDGPRREAVVAEYPVPNLRTIRRRFPQADTSRFEVALRSIRVGLDKLIERSDGEQELYDLDADPGERRNLAAARPDTVASLADRLSHVVGDWSASPEVRAVDDSGLAAVRDRLRALGYI